MNAPTVLWHRLDVPGHEAARLTSRGSDWVLEGTAAFLHERQPCCLTYSVICSSAWHTLACRLSGWVGPNSIEVNVEADGSHRWRLNGAEAAAVEGCIDVDLNFSPSTNLLPIRRLNLAVGQSAEVRAAWLRFPGFNLEPLQQSYRRIDETTYRYESAGGTFVRDLQVAQSGLVLLYPGFWEAELAD
jgi:hypothetical protein